jgi:ParB family transcriptional regulator, chromosome partitioning protein
MAVRNPASGESIVAIAGVANAEEGSVGKEQKRLGRGLDSLVSSTVFAPRGASPADPAKASPASIAPPDEVSPDLTDDAASELEVRDESLRRVRSIDILGRTRSLSIEEERSARQTLSAAEIAAGGSAVPDAVAPRKMMMLSLDAAVPAANQPRRTFDSETIAELAKSIAQAGLIQPIVVRPIPAEGRIPGQPVEYEIVAGERRWRAARAAGLAEVPAVVRELDDEAALEVSLIENIHREDLNPMDRAAAYERYCREFKLGADEVARRVGEDRTTVTNYLRLLELPEEVKRFVSRGQIDMGHARAILGVAGEEERVQLARATLGHALSVRALEEIVRRKRVPGSVTEGGGPTGGGAGKAGRTRPVQRPHIADVESRLQQSVGTKVTIREGRSKGTGRIIIEYYSLDDFDRIAEMLGLSGE